MPNTFSKVFHQAVYETGLRAEMSYPHDTPHPAAPFSKPRFETYEEADRYLAGFVNHERLLHTVRRTDDLFGLTRIHRLLERMENPQLGLKGIHLAGTKGKGSTAIFAEAILRAQGVKTGLFTSPHLVDKEERIQVAGRAIGKKEFLEWMNRLRPALAELADSPQPPTFFDILTTMMFLHFRKQAVEAVVLEVGLGGRLDSTNVFQADACVITTLGLDHTEQLGHTLASIAAEKAGIIKNTAPVVSHPQEPEARLVLEEKCLTMGAPLAWVGEQVRIEPDTTGRSAPFSVRTPRACYAGLTLSALGGHQRVNAAAAIAVVETFLEKVQGRLPDPEKVRKALFRTCPPGRIELLAQEPLLVVDGAHNPLAMESLLATLKEEFRFEKLHVVFACARDKDIRGMLSLLTRTADRWTLTAFDFPRIEHPAAIEAWLTKINPGANICVAADPEAALENAYARSGPRDCILCCGSFYLAGEILKRMNVRFASGQRLQARWPRGEEEI